MKEIKLNKGEISLVDDDMFDAVNKYKWGVIETKSGGKYAYCSINNKMISMHVFLLGKRIGLVIDHIDHNGLNNQLSNLRFATRTENSINKVRDEFRGIKFNGKRYTSRIYKNGKYITIGTFDTKKEAIDARDKKGVELFHEYWNLK